MKSFIEFINSKPCINADSHLYSPFAYTSYFEENGRYDDFTAYGYKIFFVNVSFTTLPINNATGFSPFLTGVFEEDEPCYDEFDNTVQSILSMCPDALIFPRINISMPLKWVKENPRETVEIPSGIPRESLFSDAFRNDAAELLRILICHIQNSRYADSIAGYQVCGGTTQEWMHHDLSGSYSEAMTEKFREWMNEKYDCADYPVPSREELFASDLSEKVSRYGEFCCEAAAETVEFFARKTKEYTHGQQIVGAFYGYNAFVNDYLTGLHGLRFIIDSPYIDFFSSPCCYDDNRASGIDWGDMIAGQSLKIHKKLYFVECDIRTHLTKRMQDSRKGKYPDKFFDMYDENGKKTVWNGPDTVELSLSAIRKAFAHQLTKGNGVWWFDMWGGWYSDSTIMAEISKMKEIVDSARDKNPSSYPGAQAVIFVDESSYLNIPRGSELAHSVNRVRVAAGNTGIPFDLCMVEDAQQVADKYAAAIFACPLPSEKGAEAVRICESHNIPYICTSREKPYYNTAQIRDFLVSAGVHCYNDEGNVICCGDGFLSVHAVKEGGINITLPREYTVVPLFDDDMPSVRGDSFSVYMKEHDTQVFELI